MTTSELTVTLDQTQIKILMQPGFFHYTGTTTPVHNHIYAEIHLIEHGECDFYVDGTRHRLRAGDSVLIPAGLYHYYEAVGDGLRHFAFQVSLSPSRPTRIHIEPAVLCEMRQAIDGYRQDGRRHRLLGYLTLVCSRFTDDPPACIPQIEDRELLIYEFFSKQYHQDISLSDLAALLNLSNKQTERIVEKYTGRSFRAEVSHHRMEAACQLMKTTSLSLTEVAARVGYKSYSGFWKAYKSLQK